MSALDVTGLFFLQKEIALGNASHCFIIMYVKINWERQRLMYPNHSLHAKEEEGSPRPQGQRNMHKPHAK